MELSVMKSHNKYREYSIGCFMVWLLLLAVVAAKRDSDRTHGLLLVFGGWCIAWVSTTIARFVYPPPKRWYQPATPIP
jgi:hypothetical protein